MNSDTWAHLEELFHAALERDASTRQNFLNQACPEGSTLRRELDQLLESVDAATTIDVEHAVRAHANQFVAGYLPGQQVGAYRVIRPIGAGGMGAVYLAERIGDFNQQVALKMVQPGLRGSHEMLLRFRAERQILANLNHPNIARLLDGGVAQDSSPYLVMEYIDGRPVDVFCQAENLGIDARLQLFRTICSAVQHAHQNLVVHRDLKPGNILVTGDGTPKLLDFGIAKLLEDNTEALTRVSARILTPEYASPEQLQGANITTATDVYGLGVVLYELLTGKRPFQTDSLSAASVEKLICNTTPERPSTATGPTVKGDVQEKISEDLDNIVLKAMHRDPARRYASCADLSDDLGRYLQGFPVAARADTFLYRARKFALRNRWATASALLFVLIVIGFSIGLAVEAAHARTQARTANEVARFLTGLFENVRPDQTRGRTLRARELLDQGADRVSKELAHEPLVESKILNTLGVTYYSLGAEDRAESLLKQAYDIRVRLFGVNSVEAAETAEALAQIATDRGQYARAREEYERLLALYTKLQGPESDSSVELMNDLANLEWTVGNYDAAKQRQQAVVAIWTRTKGPENNDTLIAENNLETILDSQGDYHAAEALGRQLLATRLKQFGPIHPDVASSYNNLATVFDHLSRLPEALASAQQALAIRHKLYGPEHPEIAKIMGLLDCLNREFGNYAQAKSFGEQALAMSIKLEGANSLDTAMDQEQLGLTMLRLSDFPRSRELLQAALKTRLDLHDPWNPELGTTFDDLGQLELAVHHLDAAEADEQQALSILEHAHARDTSDGAVVLAHLGEVLAAQDNYSAAERNSREALRIARSKFSSAHLVTASALFALGNVLQQEGRGAEAGPLLTECLAMRRKLLPANHPDVIEAASAAKPWQTASHDPQSAL